MSASVVYDGHCVDSTYSEIDDREQGEGHTAAYNELDETQVYDEVQDDAIMSSTQEQPATYSNEDTANDVMVGTTMSQHR